MISYFASRWYFGLLSAFLVIFLFFAVFSQVGTDMSSSDILIQSFREKGILPKELSIFYLSPQDSILVDELLSLDLTNMTEEEAMSKFYWFIAFPVQGVCRYLELSKLKTLSQVININST